jgi:uncharacterized membrane protein
MLSFLNLDAKQFQSRAQLCFCDLDNTKAEGRTRSDERADKMLVQFEFTQDDLVDVSKRSMARSKVTQAWRWQGMVYSALFAWLLVFAFFFSTPLKGALIGLAAAAVSALIFPATHKRGLDKRLRKLLRENLGDRNSFICEVELTSNGVSTKQMNQEITTEWQSIKEIVATDDSVDIIGQHGGGVVVRNRAFESPEHRKQFVDLARSYLESSRGTAPIQ